jgi:hypothetical protein
LSAQIYITPSASFLPPRQENLVEKSGPHYLTIPFRTTYKDPSGKECEAVSFDPIQGDKSIGDIVDFASILESMFALGRYPRLEDNQLFCMRCVVINYEKEELVIVGHIFEKDLTINGDTNE